MITDDQKLACVERELILRRRNYPRWVAAGKMRQPDADHEIAAMEAIADDYRARRLDLFNPAGKGQQR